MLALCLSGGRALSAAQTAAPSQPRIPGGGYRIAGIAVSMSDQRPLAHALVLLRDVKNPQSFRSFVTSEEGKFDFSGLPAGKYGLEGGKRGFIPAGYDQHDRYSSAIVTGAGFDTETLVLRLAPAAVVSGKILDEFGEPVRHAIVSVYFDDHSSGASRIRQIQSAQTDDLGSYEITSLLPGTYFLSARGTPWYAVHAASAPEEQSGEAGVDRSLDVAYPLTYYADVTDADNATPIPVRGGERLQVNVRLDPVPALRVLFRMPDSGANSFTFPQLQQPAFDDSVLVGAAGRMISPGILEVTGVPAGRYNVRAGGFGGGDQAVQMTGIDLTKDEQDIDIASAEALSNVKVAVETPNEAMLPPRLSIGLHTPHGAHTAWQAVDPKGQAELQQVPAGAYEIVISNFGKPYSIVHISAEQAEFSGHTITVKAGSSPSISLSLAAGSSTIQGKVERAEKPVAGAMVVLVPKDPGANRDLFRRDQSDMDGTFSLPDVLAGSYTIIAIADGWDLNWSQPGVIAAYLSQGRNLEVGKQSPPIITVSQPIQVQSK
jgi:hypothetical protein